MPLTFSNSVSITFVETRAESNGNNLLGKEKVYFSLYLLYLTIPPKISSHLRM